MSRRDASEGTVQLTFEIPVSTIDGDGRVHPEKLFEVLELFQKKLMGVRGEQGAASNGSIQVSLRVSGGAYPEHLERLWRDHLAEHGVKVER